MQKQPKNIIGFVNDHSGSMASLATAAKNDYNATITAVKDAASREMLDTIVSVVAIGYPHGRKVTRQVVISNPHVLKPLADWAITGGTPLYDGIGDMIELFESLPDANEQHVSFLVMATTDGEEIDSVKYNTRSLRSKIEALQRTGRWTFVMRVPKGKRHTVSGLGIPMDNVQEWETSTAGMAKSTVATTAAMDGYFAARSAGKTSSTVFYASAAAVDTSALVDITKDVSLYVVPSLKTGDVLEIRDFILTKRMKFLKGAAFYQLTKTESKIAPAKMIAVRDRTTGKIYAGKDASGKDIPRQMLGLPTDRNVRLHPGDHGNFDIFIQSSSVNRHLVGDTGVLYWEAIGVEFTAADLAYLQPKPVTPAVVQLPAVPVSNKPTPHPQKVKAKVAATPSASSVLIAQHKLVPAKGNYGLPQPIVPNDGGRVRYHVAPANAVFYATRDLARAYAMIGSKKAFDAGPTALKGGRFFVA